MMATASPRFRTWLPGAVLLTGLSLTLAATYFFARFSDARDQRRFDLDAQEATKQVQTRLGSYIALLRGGSALLAVKPDFSREDWSDFVQRLRVSEFYPGVQGIGVSF